MAMRRSFDFFEVLQSYVENLLDSQKRLGLSLELRFHDFLERIDQADYTPLHFPIRAESVSVANSLRKMPGNTADRGIPAVSH